MAKSTRKTITRYRDSGSGRFITKRKAERKDPRTWERERIRTGKR